MSPRFTSVMSPRFYGEVAQVLDFIHFGKYTNNMFQYCSVSTDQLQSEADDENTLR